MLSLRRDDRSDVALDSLLTSLRAAVEAAPTMSRCECIWLRYSPLRATAPRPFGMQQECCSDTRQRICRPTNLEYDKTRFNGAWRSYYQLRLIRKPRRCDGWTSS